MVYGWGGMRGEERFFIMLIPVLPSFFVAFTHQLYFSIWKPRYYGRAPPGNKFLSKLHGWRLSDVLARGCLFYPAFYAFLFKAGDVGVESLEIFAQVSRSLRLRNAYLVTEKKFFQVNSRVVIFCVVAVTKWLQTGFTQITGDLIY